MPQIRLFLLGAPRIERDGEPVDIERRKAIALLAYVALTGEGHSREALATFFWPDTEQSRAYAYLRTMLWTLNKALGDAWLEAERETIGIRPGSDLWGDVARFRQQAGDDDLASLGEAAALYRGEFMAGFTLPDSPEFDSWQFFQRESLRREFAALMQTLVNGYTQHGDFEAAIPHARRWLASDSLNEAAHRALMQLYTWTGQRAAALRQYQTCVAALESELGVKPEPETQVLFQAILERRISAPAAAASPAAPARSSLPAQTTLFIGREKELAEITRLLDDPACRLLTLLGPGGVGKTRLALQTASQFEGQFEHGVCFIPFAPVSSTAFIESAVTDALHFAPFREVDSKTQLLVFLREKHLLLVADNFEHLAEGADFLSEILSAAPGVKILVTSRERLRLHEEWVYELQGMRYPATASVTNVDEYEAAQLFMETARRTRPDFAPTEADKPYIAHICRLVEGLPLGVELAATWVQMLSCQEIGAEIERSLDFLTASLRNLPPRHRSLRAVFESSWERLSPAEQRTLAWLSIFRGGFRREAAEAVAGTSLPLLAALVGNSLLRRTSAGRFEMHELLRQFAEERLNLSPNERAEAHTLHSDYYATQMQHEDAALKGRGQIAALDAIEEEIDNMRAAWEWAVRGRKVAEINQLLPGMTLFYEMRSRFRESYEVIERAEREFNAGRLSEEERIVLAQIQMMLASEHFRFGKIPEGLALYKEVNAVFAPLTAEQFALYFLFLARLSDMAGETCQAIGWLKRALRQFQASGDLWGIAQARYLQGDVVHREAKFSASKRHYRQSLDLSREIGDSWSAGIALKGLGEVAYSRGEYQEAEELYHEGLAHSEALGDLNGVGMAMNRIGVMLSAQGKFEEAKTYLRRGLGIAQQLGDPWARGWGLFDLGEVLVAQREYNEARVTLEESTVLLEALKDRGWLVWVLCYRSRIALARGDIAEAKRLADQGLGVSKYSNLYATSAAHYYVGETTCLLEDTEAAGYHLLISLKIAVELHSIIQILRHLVGVARWQAQLGETEEALELLTFVINHRASWQETRDWATRLFSEIAAELPPQTVAECEARGRRCQLEEIIAHFLLVEEKA